MSGTIPCGIAPFYTLITFDQGLMRITHNKTATIKNEASILTSPVHSKSSCGIISHEKFRCVLILYLSTIDRLGVRALSFVVYKPLSRA